MKLATLFVNKAKQLTIARGLSSHGVEVIPAQSVGGLLHLLRRSDVQAVLLEDADTELIDWLATLEMRMAGAVPVIVVGGSAGVGMSEALQHGATAYAEYDGAVDQLLARLRARVGSRGTPARQGMEVGPYSLCSVTSAVWRDGVEINLTAREFALAWVLFSNAGRVVSAASLSARVWGRSNDVCKRTLEQHIYKLRRKLSAESSRELLRIHAVYSVGYRLDLMVQNPVWEPPAERDVDWEPPPRRDTDPMAPVKGVTVSQEVRSGPISEWAS